MRYPIQAHLLLASLLLLLLPTDYQRTLPKRFLHWFIVRTYTQNVLLRLLFVLLLLFRFIVVERVHSLSFIVSANLTNVTGRIITSKGLC